MGITTLAIEWKQLLLGEENWEFLLEILVRTLVMYLIILFALSFLGKRGVKQLSVFELVIIISFGSAAGDPMFYQEVGLLSALTVLLVIISSYKLTTYLVFKSDRVEKMIEGEPICLINDGRFSIQNFAKEPIGYDEFFGEMRQKSVSHLGQIELAIIEISGEISLFYFPDSQVKYGLPILPELYKEKHKQLLTKGMYSCSYCGYTEKIEPTDNHICPVCRKDEWVLSLNSKRIT